MSDRGNEFMKEHGAKREFWDENLKFKYYKKTFREYWGSVYGLPHQPFPDAALTCEPKYQQWCVGISGYMPVDRGKNFKTFIRERLAEAEEQEIPPSLEDGVEIEVVVLNILKNALRSARNFDDPQESDELRPGEGIFTEAAEDSKCGREVYIKFEWLKARVLHEVSVGNTETKLTRAMVIAWLEAHGRHCSRNATVNRRRSAYVLPYSLVAEHQVFALKAFTPGM